MSIRHVENFAWKVEVGFRATLRVLHENAITRNLLKSCREQRAIGINLTVPPQYAYKRRAFLCPIDSLENSYVCAVVESSDNGFNHLGNNMLTLADCRRIVEIEFSLHDASHRRESLAKADILAKTFNGFRDALRAEADLIKNYKADTVAKEGKNKKSKNSQRRGGRR